ncbi:hypothetical protein CK203_089744 [Vitis vinifera]|uniref:Uncharacterized protein n=1 Tax=Vitis vinifera TaxID=29760 RepID=A0A438BLE5_VITVI|nr:hypothetical protein CK203_089744 [Vitis vinifera]
MLPQPPIEGNWIVNSAFHSELCFDLQHSDTDFYQSMTTKEVRIQLDSFHYRWETWILGARHIAEALQIPLSQPNSIILELGQILLSWRCIGPKEGESLGSSLQDVRRIFLWASSSDHGSPSLFEEKVHKRSFKELIAFPPLPKAAMPNFGALGYPLSLSWRESEYAESSPRHIPEGITVAAPAIPRAPPAAPASSQPSTSAEPRMAIPISEYRELCRALETLTASQSNLAQEMAAIKHAKSRC